MTGGIKMIGKIKVDFTDLRSKAKSAKEKFLHSKDITKCNREAIIYICDQLLDGIDKCQFHAVPDNGRVLLFVIELSSQGYCIKTIHRGTEVLRTFKCKTETGQFIAEMGVFVNELGCEMKLVGSMRLGSLEISCKC